MIHFLQCLWWEWRWKRLKAELARIQIVLPMAWLACGRDSAEYSEVMRVKLQVERDMADLERKMRVSVRP